MKAVNTKTDTVDVLIIGAGASGSVAAKHLSAAGFSVVIRTECNEADFAKSRLPRDVDRPAEFPSVGLG